VAVTDITNLMLEGKTPASVRGTLFGANLLAIAKKKGGIRPIAVGYVWRRLAAKVACSYVKEAGAALLSPRQLGFGVPGGAEAAVRAARRHVDSMTSGQLLIMTDFRNAFNTIRRDAILEAVPKHFPELLSYVASTIGGPSCLQFGQFVLHSEEGAQQGDPLGSLCFCLTIKELLESMQS
jgi:Reverse transcriptase (RNA-dependent DNA polymerase)